MEDVVGNYKIHAKSFDSKGEKVHPRKMYSPLSKKKREERFAKGQISKNYELCHHGQRRRCEESGYCLGFDPDALSICEEVMVPAPKRK